MKFSYKNWKKVKAEKDHTIFQNDKGDELKVAHSRLSPKIRAELASLPVHMASGGKVEKDDEEKDKKDEEIKDIELKDAPMESAPDMSAPQPMSATATEMASSPSAAQPLPEIPLAQRIGHHIGSSVSNALGDAGRAIGNVGGAIVSPFVNAAQGAVQGAQGVDPQQAAMAQQQAAQAPVAPQAASAPGIAPDSLGTAQSAPVAAPAQSPGLAQDEMGLYQKGISEQEQGLKKEAAAVAEQAKAEAKALQDSQMAQQKILADYQTDYKAKEAEYNSVLADYQNGHIDPSHVWSSKNVPNKIATVIGILASGLGAGMAGGNSENMAMKVLNSEIDRDIDAQKANIHSKGNILNALSSQMGNMRAGTEMLRSIKLGIAAEEMKKAAAVAKDPMAQARLLEESGKLHAAAAPVIAKMAAQNTVNKLMSEVNKDPTRAPMLFQAMRKLDPKQAQEMEQRYVPGMGFALTDNDAKELKELKGTVDTVKTGVKELLKINKTSGSSISLEQRAKAEVISKSLVGLLRVPLTGPGAMNEGERKMLEEIVANPTKIFSLSSSNKTRLTQLTKLMDEKMATSAKARGLTVQSPDSQLNPQQQQFARWARANPKDKRSAVILAKLGLE